MQIARADSQLDYCRPCQLSKLLKRCRLNPRGRRRALVVKASSCAAVVATLGSQERMMLARASGPSDPTSRGHDVPKAPTRHPNVALWRRPKLDECISRSIVATSDHLRAAIDYPLHEMSVLKARLDWYEAPSGVHDAPGYQHAFGSIETPWRAAFL